MALLGLELPHDTAANDVFRMSMRQGPKRSGTLKNTPIQTNKIEVFVSATSPNQG